MGNEGENYSAELTINDVVDVAVCSIISHQQEAKKAEDSRRHENAIQFKNSEIAALLPTFTGHEDDVESWVKRVDAIQEAYQVPDNVMKLIVVGRLEGQAKAWHNTKLEYITMPWNDFKTEMSVMFSSRPNKVTLMRKMESRKWRKSEKFSNYFTDKVVLGNKLNLSEEDIIDYVIDGFDNSNLQSQARMKNFTSSSELLQIMKNVTNEDRGQHQRMSDSQP